MHKEYVSISEATNIWTCHIDFVLFVEDKNENKIILKFFFYLYGIEFSQNMESLLKV